MKVAAWSFSSWMPCLRATCARTSSLHWISVAVDATHHPSPALAGCC